MKLATYNDANESTFHRLISAIEFIRIKRMDHYRRKHPDGKRFTQQELNDFVCPTYKNYLDGRSRRMPSRATLLAIATYLECTLDERNHLLQVARYAIEPAPVADEHLAPLLAYGRKLMRDLQFPSLLVTRDYRVHTVCPNLTTLIGTPPIGEIPESQRNLFDIVSSPLLSPRIDEESRRHFKLALLHHLKFQNRVYEQQDWYRNAIERVYTDAGIRLLWASLEIGADSDACRSGIAVYDEQAVGFEILVTPVDLQKQVYVINLLPADEDAHTVFTAIGCHQSPNHDDICLKWAHDYKVLQHRS